MAYEEPKTEWPITYEPSTLDMERIERNIKAIAEEDFTFSGIKTFGANTVFNADVDITGTLDVTGAITGASLDVGSGAISGGAISGSTINTGDGGYKIGQNVRPSDSVAFGNMTLTGAMLPAMTDTGSIVTSASTTTTYFPQGDYLIRLGYDIGESSWHYLEFRIGTTWRILAIADVTNAYGQLALFIKSDGTNSIRMRQIGEATLTAYYQKF